MAKVMIAVDLTVKELAAEIAKERGLFINQYIAKVVAADARSTATAITSSMVLEQRLEKIAEVQKFAEGRREAKREVAISNLRKAHRKRRNMMQMRERRKQEREERENNGGD